MPRSCLLLALATLLSGLSLLSAQGERCGALVERALAGIEQHCANLQRDRLCIAQAPVSLEFAGEHGEPRLAAPGEQVPLANLARLRTGAAAADGGWGMALLRLGRLLPQTDSGAGTILLVAGAAELINEIPPERVKTIGAPLSTVALEETLRFKLPGVIPAPVGALAAGELTLVDAYDSSGGWLRSVDGGAISWLPSAKLARLQAMAALPRIGLGASFPLQALSLATSATYADCHADEPLIALQTPAGEAISLSVNGVDISIGSLVTFQQVHPSALSLTVHRGEVTTIFGGTARAGESMVGILVESPEREYGILEWSGALPASAAEVARGERAQEAFNRLARVNGWGEGALKHQPPPVTHFVAAGEGLYPIAEQYDTSVASIVIANELERPFVLYRGQELLIPEPGSGFAGLHEVPLPTAMPADA